VTHILITLSGRTGGGTGRPVLNDAKGQAGVDLAYLNSQIGRGIARSVRPGYAVSVASFHP